jgi:hypothetical protein
MPTECQGGQRIQGTGTNAPNGVILRYYFKKKETA